MVIGYKNDLGQCYKFYFEYKKIVLIILKNYIKQRYVFLSWEFDKICYVCELMFWFIMKVNILYFVFFCWYMYVNSFLDVFVYFKSKINLFFIRERIIILVYVYSLLECVMWCFV